MRQRRRHRLAGLVTTLACLWTVGGCQSLEMGREEMIWQAMHAMDVAQTLNAGSDPCYEENAWLSKRLIGEQPSDAEVVAWGIGTAVFRAWVSNALHDRGAAVWVEKL